MPVMECKEDGKPGYKWGEKGKCYTYNPGSEVSRERAKEKAKTQGQAIKSNQTKKAIGEITANAEGFKEAERLVGSGFKPIVFNNDLEALRLADFNEGTIKMSSMKQEDKNGNRYVVVDAVAAIGDKFYGNIYVPSDTLRDTVTQWNGTYNDLSHLGTMYPAGTSFVENVDYITGYNSDAYYDESINGVRMKMHINCAAPKYSSWRNIIDIANAAGKIPNVSIFGFSKFTRMSVDSLPSGVRVPNGASSGGNVIAMSNIVPFAVTTCLRGKCNDSEGCGISSGFSEPNKIFTYDCNGSLCDIDKDVVNSESTEIKVDKGEDEIKKIEKEILEERIKKEKIILKERGR